MTENAALTRAKIKQRASARRTIYQDAEPFNSIRSTDRVGRNALPRSRMTEHQYGGQYRPIV